MEKDVNDTGYACYIYIILCVVYNLFNFQGKISLHNII